MSGGLSAVELGALAATASVAGAGVSAYSQNQQLRRQDQITADGVRQQQQLQSQANAGVTKTIQKVAQQNGANENANRESAQAQYADALRRAVPVQGSNLQATPGASSRYAKSLVDAQASNKAFGANQAALMARTDAPQLTQLQDQQNLGDAATKLGLISDTSASEARQNQLLVNGVQQNPWLQSASALLKGVGSGASVYAGGMGAPGAAGGSGLSEVTPSATRIGMPGVTTNFEAAGLG